MFVRYVGEWALTATVWRERGRAISKKRQKRSAQVDVLCLYFFAALQAVGLLEMSSFLSMVSSISGTSSERFLTITFRISSVKYRVYFLVFVFFRAPALIFKKNWTRNIKKQTSCPNQENDPWGSIQPHTLAKRSCSLRNPESIHLRLNPRLDDSRRGTGPAEPRRSICILARKKRPTSLFCIFQESELVYIFAKVYILLLRYLTRRFDSFGRRKSSAARSGRHLHRWSFQPQVGWDHRHSPSTSGLVTNVRRASQHIFQRNHGMDADTPQGFAQLRASIMCLRGSRVRHTVPWNDLPADVVVCEGRLGRS